MNKIFIACSFLFSTWFSCHAQEMISRRLNYQDSTLAPKKELSTTKKNSKWGGGSSVELIGFIPQKNHISGMNNQGLGIGIGMEFHRKFCSASALVMGLGYQQQSAGFDRGNQFPISNPLFHRQTLSVGALNVRILDRIFLNSSAKSSRSFIDIGGYANFFRTGTLITEYRYNPNVNGSHVGIEYARKLEYINPLEYGGMIRLGNQFLSVFYQYRLTHYFKSTSGYNDIPKSMFGISIGGNN
jgi:hypothetical protein